MAANPLEHMALEHSGPHIPGVFGESIPGWSFGNFEITTTLLSTWIFMGFLGILVAIFYVAIMTEKLPRVRTFGLDIISRLEGFLVDIIGNRKYARAYFPMLGGFFTFILLSNFFGLILDYFNLSFPFLHSYLRPFNADMSTTLGMAASVIVVAQISSMYRRGLVNHWKHYLLNFSGNSLFEKILNVPIGWLHFVSELTRILSLSVRLFANIFAGVALIAVMAYLGSLIPLGPLGSIVTLPIWFFEILVACVQAFIFMMLSAIYIKEAVTYDNHH